jgi:hypothetical protein
MMSSKGRVRRNTRDAKTAAPLGSLETLTDTQLAAEVEMAQLLAENNTLKSISTYAAFFPRIIEHCKANKQKPSGE